MARKSPYLAFIVNHMMTLIQYLFNNTPQLLDYVLMRLSKLTSQFYGIKLVIMTMIILIKYDEINRELGL